MVRRKLSGDLDSMTCREPTTLQSAAAAHRPTIRRTSKKPTTVTNNNNNNNSNNNSNNQNFGSVLGQVLDNLDHQDDLDDHVFLRRSRSNKFLFVRDDSMGDLISNRGSNSDSDTTCSSPVKQLHHNRHIKNSKQPPWKRRSSVGPLTIPPLFAGNALPKQQQQQQQHAMNYRRSSDPGVILSQLNLDTSDDDDESDNDEGFFLGPEQQEEQQQQQQEETPESSSTATSANRPREVFTSSPLLGELMKSLDEDSSHDSHIFCSQRHLTFQDDSSSDGDESAFG
jgi:hypothetical protein